MCSPLVDANGPGQSGNWQSVIDTARKEGRVVLYANTVPAVNERIKADFDQAYPGIVLEASASKAINPLDPSKYPAQVVNAFKQRCNAMFKK